MDDGSSTVQVVDESSSDDDSLNYAAGNRGQVEDTETTSEGNNEAANLARYSVSLFSITVQMDTIPSEDNTGKQANHLPIEVAVLSRIQSCVCKQKIVSPSVTTREEHSNEMFI
ncbi:unnamed protein product [Rotaria magnacalcarata]|uniref:Uncharacterized protein n=1 Tax=Rotaria magnacalcarata TaxID=392030 RepID=A0A815RQD3_9BILA|nr:unnamed protein product [Rotaria magnacalcarata]CAF2124326.1 unnamed protein product [Rotaria magnacalcarata]CAF3824665.1 unnamed protein product [Rotaria magnacalcarata]